MKSKKAKKIIVDTSVAAASGGKNAVHPTSINCRDFFWAFFKTWHNIAMSDDILKEWKKHESRFAKKWRLQMIAKNRLNNIDFEEDKKLRNAIDSENIRTIQKKIMLKDCHLIEVAQMCNKSVVSLDEKVRELFSDASKNISKLRRIMWVNPDKVEDDAHNWISNGAKLENSRLLGYVANN